jgi:signal transduction histidine kinase
MRWRCSGSSCWADFLVILCGLAGAAAFGQPVQGWRMYQADDGLRESFAATVNIGPRGRVWVGHGETDAFSWLDGYTVSNVVCGAGGNYDVYESRSGQLWAPYLHGVQVFSEGRWLQYPVVEVRAESQTNVLRRVRPLSLVPAEHDRVLFVLGDRLMEFNAAERQAAVLKLASQTRLGRFVDIGGTRDGGAWVGGARGVARLPGPHRNLGAQTEWREFVVPAELRLENFQRPLEDDSGGVTWVADAVATGRKVMAHFDGQGWIVYAFPDENARYAWHDRGQTFWVATISAVHRLRREQETFLVVESILTGQNFDVAVEPKGVFWVATSAGLLRYGPTLWGVPDGLPAQGAATTAIAEEAGGRLWVLAGSDLLSIEDTQVRLLPVASPAELNVQRRTPLSTLATGQLAIGFEEAMQVFSPVSGTLHTPAHPSGNTCVLLGPMNDGRVATLVPAAEGDAAARPPAIESFDGQRFERVAELPSEWREDREGLAFFQARGGEVWLGSSARLARFRDYQWQGFTAAEAFHTDGVLCWLDAGEGRIWRGGRDKIVEYDGRRWVVIGSGFDRVNAMARGRGGVWVASANGLHRYQAGSWVRHGVEDGLPSLAIYDVYEDVRGRVWIATSRGVRSYRMDADLDAPRSRILPFEDDIKPSEDGTIRFAVAGRDKWKQTVDERLLYSFRVDGNAWAPFASGPMLTLTNPPAGAHRLYVKAMDRNWNEEREPLFAEFTVVLPWNQDPRLVAITVAGLMATACLGWLAVNRHRRLLRSYAEVERIVAERTRQLERANEELLLGQKMRALGTLAAGIAHDFNNILSIIKGSVQIIEGHLDDREKIRTRVQRIRTVVDQGAAVVKSMLGYSRPSGPSGPSLIQLAASVEDTFRILGDRLAREIVPRLEADPGLPAVRGHADLLQQMLVNLILNAADAMDGRGEVRVVIESIARLPRPLVLQPSSADRFAQLSVHDRGCGIAPEVLPRVFEPFFTTKSLSTRRGTGLGLYMVYEFAKVMGWGLAVESVVGQGSVFRLIIPIPVVATEPA